jgi:hypothetical protein
MVLSLVLCILSPLFAQQKETRPEAAPQYSLGDQTLAVNAGIFMPLFFMSWQPAAYSTHLSVGGIGSLQWQAYLTPNIRLGIEVGGLFALSPNSNLLLMLPITAKISYSFTIYPFEIPIYLGAGMNIVKYQDSSIIDPLLKPGASLFWIFNSSWSFGVNTVYWWDMQFAADPSQSRVGNFLEVSFSALYHY